MISNTCDSNLQQNDLDDHKIVVHRTDTDSDEVDEQQQQHLDDDRSLVTERPATPPSVFENCFDNCCGLLLPCSDIDVAEESSNKPESRSPSSSGVAVAAGASAVVAPAASTVEEDESPHIKTTSTENHPEESCEKETNLEHTKLGTDEDKLVGVSLLDRSDSDSDSNSESSNIDIELDIDAVDSWERSDIEIDERIRQSKTETATESESINQNKDNNNEIDNSIDIDIDKSKESAKPYPTEPVVEEETENMKLFKNRKNKKNNHGGNSVSEEKSTTDNEEQRKLVEEQKRQKETREKNKRFDPSRDGQSHTRKRKAYIDTDNLSVISAPARILLSCGKRMKTLGCHSKDDDEDFHPNSKVVSEKTTTTKSVTRRSMRGTGRRQGVPKSSTPKLSPVASGSASVSSPKVTFADTFDTADMTIMSSETPMTTPLYQEQKVSTSTPLVEFLVMDDFDEETDETLNKDGHEANKPHRAASNSDPPSVDNTVSCDVSKDSIATLKSTESSSLQQDNTKCTETSEPSQSYTSKKIQDTTPVQSLSDETKGLLGTKLTVQVRSIDVPKGQKSISETIPNLDKTLSFDENENIVDDDGQKDDKGGVGGENHAVEIEQQQKVSAQSSFMTNVAFFLSFWAIVWMIFVGQPQLQVIPGNIMCGPVAPGTIIDPDIVRNEGGRIIYHSPWWINDVVKEQDDQGSIVSSSTKLWLYDMICQDYRTTVLDIKFRRRFWSWFRRSNLMVVTFTEDVTYDPKNEAVESNEIRTSPLKPRPIVRQNNVKSFMVDLWGETLTFMKDARGRPWERKNKIYDGHNESILVEKKTPWSKNWSHVV